MTWKEQLAANTVHSTCRNCGESITSTFKGRWVSVEHGDICLKADQDKYGPYGAININRIHASEA